MGYLTTKEVAEILKVSEDTVHKWLITGLLPYLELGEEEDGRRILQEDLDRFLEQRRNDGNIDYESYATFLQEKESYARLYKWFRQEHQQLANFYHELDQCIHQLVHHLSGRMEESHNGQDRTKANAYHELLMHLYKRVERPRREYHQWITDYENRLKRFKEQKTADTHDFVFEDNISYQMKLADLKPPMTRSTPASRGIVSAVNLQQMKEHRDLYAFLSAWTRAETELLSKHYLRLQRVLQRVVEECKEMVKKASKRLDFTRGQVFNSAVIHIYQEFEKHRRVYNEWLTGYERRWHHFKVHWAEGEPESPDNLDIVTAGDPYNESPGRGGVDGGEIQSQPRGQDWGNPFQNRR